MFPLIMETRQSKRETDKKKNNPSGEDFLVVRIVLDGVKDSVVGLGEIMVSEDIELFEDKETDWIDNRW